MKFFVPIWWLLISIDLVSFVSCEKLEAEKADSENKEDENLKERWELEKTKFKKGLKVMNDKGELVEMTPEDKPPLGSARRCLKKDVYFKLYTRKNPTTPHTLAIDINSKKNPDLGFFDNRKLTFFVTHGWVNSGDSDSCTKILNALLQAHDVNVIILDWGFIALSVYGWVVSNLKFVSNSVATMITFLKEKARMDLARVTLIGHSLGAHVMGVAGHLTNGTVGTIFGLDPALPLFFTARPGHRISKMDAKHVQIIHTCGGMLGYDKAIGTSDFFPDGGVRQSNCAVDVGGACSHSRAYEYYAQSILSKETFKGHKCEDKSNFISGHCKNYKVGRMGGLTPDPGMRGSYYFWINKTNKPKRSSLVEGLRDFFGR